MSYNNIDVLAKAKAGLILDHPFFASLLLQMPLVSDLSIKTFATDGDAVYYNPEYLATLQLPEVLFVLAHEVLHGVFEHMYTIGDKNHNRWNQATDYVINQILTDDKIGSMPIGGLLNPSLVKQGGATSEGVYAILPKESENKKTGDKDGALDDIKPANCRDEAEQEAKQAEMKMKVLQAKQTAKIQGKLSTGIDRLVSEVTRVDTPWRDILRRFLSERAKIDFSFSRPKRRFLADDVYLPNMTGEKLGSVDLLVDCSGSINDKLLVQFQAEINGIKQDVNPSMIRVIYFDTAVLKLDTFGPDDDITIKPVGGGGTAFSPVFKYINESDVQPMACVVLTDLCCNDFGDMPAYPVLWASTDRNGKAPWGEITYLKAAV